MSVMSAPVAHSSSAARAVAPPCTSRRSTPQMRTTTRLRLPPGGVACALPAALLALRSLTASVGLSLRTTFWHCLSSAAAKLSIQHSAASTEKANAISAIGLRQKQNRKHAHTSSAYWTHATQGDAHIRLGPSQVARASALSSAARALKQKRAKVSLWSGAALQRHPLPHGPSPPRSTRYLVGSSSERLPQRLGPLGCAQSRRAHQRLSRTCWVGGQSRRVSLGPRDAPWSCTARGSTL